MTKPRRWEESIRAPWFRLPSLLLVLTAVAAAQRTDAVSLLADGVQLYRQKSYAVAARTLQNVPGRVPLLADYAGFFLGLSLYEEKNYPAAFQALQITFKNPVPSPMTGRAVLTAADCLIQMNQPKEAINLIRQYRTKLPAPDAEAMQAKGFEAAGDLVSAAVGWQKVYYGYPTSDVVGDAVLALARLRMQLADRYPPVLGKTILARAKVLLDARRYEQARTDLESAIATLGGEDRDVAQVRLAAVDLQARMYQKALTRLASLSVSAPEADAERMYHIVVASRRLDRDDEMERWLREMDKKHPNSPWRTEALVSAAYVFLTRNDTSKYEPLYRACVEGTPDHPQASFCHWKNTWAAYLRDSSKGVSLFQEHLKRYPDSEKTPASIYFLGRQAQQAQDLGAARVFFAFAAYNYPNHYYGVLSQELLQEPTILRASESVDAKEFLTSLKVPNRRVSVVFDALPVTKQRLERAKLLAAAIPDLAELELRFAARNDGQPHIIAVELARLLDRRGAPDEALRAVKAYVPNYLNFPFDSVPQSFWRVAFPMPYREPLERHARSHSLDPYVVAGLIRQESEFNPKAVSVAKAYGLTQVLPSTGRYLSRKAGIKRFTPNMLFQPEVNLKLGTTFLRQQLDTWNTRWEQTLAAYNAGPTRVKRWIQWGTFREPAEFIETIPFNETRDYVQIVLRNASVYRKLYGSKNAALPSGDGDRNPAAPRVHAAR
jgi:soluble lytic murein transglycosylase